MYIVLNPTHACRVGCSFCYFPGAARPPDPSEFAENLAHLTAFLDARRPERPECVYLSINDTGRSFSPWEGFVTALATELENVPLEATTTSGAALGIRAECWSRFRRVSLSIDREKALAQKGSARELEAAERLAVAGCRVSFNLQIHEPNHVAGWVERRDEWYDLAEHVYLIVPKPAHRFFENERALFESIWSLEETLAPVRPKAIFDTCISHALGIKKAPTCRERFEIGPGDAIRRCPHDPPLESATPGFPELALPRECPHLFPPAA